MGGTGVTITEKTKGDEKAVITLLTTLLHFAADLHWYESES
jgi:hypothetical protein